MSGDRATDAGLLERLLDVIAGDILPLTAAGVARGNKIFGAAILRKADRSLVLAETNNEIENPLWHGEVHALKRLYELPAAGRPEPKDCLFLATHEPCSLCLSAITWAGYDNFYYLFSHTDSRDAFAIPHDLRILKAVFGLEPGGYNARNAYWTSYAIPRLVEGLATPERDRLQARIDALAGEYMELSRRYQEGKAGSTIPLK
jgi:tRNA(Arg) A34 adenosine deaminase TadA